MNDCPDVDALLSATAALDWSEAALQHVARCPRCRAARDELRVAHEALGGRETPAAGFADRVLSNLPGAEAAHPGRARVASLLLPPLVALTCLAALAATAGPAPPAPGPALGAALLAGLLAAARGLRRPHPPPG